jgi:hypothetical protein
LTGIVGRISTANLVKVWRPSNQFLGSSALAVPYSGRQKMSREQFGRLLESRLEELIESNPKEAQRVLSNNPEHLPDLLEISYLVARKGWPAAILACGQMQMLLNQIDWSQDGQSLELPENELPSLEEVAEALPG